ncbi:MAG: putative mitogen-activated protein kinase kinase kinase 8.1, partial [Streblomastix strix]
NPQSLGSGQFGRVYLAQCANGKLIAVKVQSNKKFKELEFAAAQFLDQIQCKYFVRAFGYKEIGDNIFILMQFASLGSLQKAIDSELIPSAKTLIIIAHNILEFLSQLHKQGLVHCDLKFSNILFAHYGKSNHFIPKVCDFGVSSRISNLKTAISIGGAPFFHPPEVRKSKGNYGPGIDIWALGINLYMLATGKKPGNPAYKLLRKIDLRLILDSPKGQELSQEHQNLIQDINGKLLMDTIGKDLLHLICLMLTINPEQRPSAAILLTHPVFLKAKFNLNFIPIRNAEQLGIIVKPMKKRALINLRPGMQIVSVPLDMQVSLQERLNQQREEIQQEHGTLIDNTVHGLLSYEVSEALAALQQIYQLSVQFDESQENVQNYVSTLGLADNLIDFLTPADEVRIEYLNALNIIIEFIKLENVSQFVDKKNILKSLSEVGIQYLKDQPEMSNVALNILFEIAKHGIKLGQGFPILTITIQNFAQLMGSVKAGNKKSIEDINIAIISLEHLLNHTTIPNIKDYLRIIENLEKYLSLNEQIPNKYIVNALELLSTIANSTQQISVFAAVVNVMSGPIIENIRSSQIRRYEVDIIEKLYIIEIVLAQNGNRFDGIELPRQQRKISPFLILPQPTEKENIINSLISQSSSNQDSQYQSFPSLQDQIVQSGYFSIRDPIAIFD